ncbi:sugar ABC transporter permease (plasmid) [Halorussus limi]|uniref:Sugar ABC transporter permease n=1 Tax=Halorussus limi TaxID=2938695 RepID=A0A8U0I0D5_9EURY|nr:sugar ABC transporter permease [Halorussus limi]UPV76740.1 sugar ABC transporter permease [Halorussus limi]
MSTVSEDIAQRDRSFRDRVLEEYGGLQGILFLLPTLVLLTGIVFYPMVVNGFLLSFKQFTLNPDAVDPWVGLENYEYWLFGQGQSLFLFSLKMTLLYELVVVPFDLVVALGAALVMNESLPARPFWRGLMLAGYASPAIAAGLVWGTMEQAATYGLVYNTLNIFFDIPASGGITSNTPWAFWGVVIAKVWRDFGFMYVVFLAGVQSIPKELYEIAKVDGAGPVQRFRYITLPHLRTVIVTVVMIRTVFTVGKVAIPWAVTKGGPVNYTTFLGVAIFKSAFLNWSMGQAAALGMVFAVGIIPLILIWVRTETEDY